jgi:hypothetical protein
MLLLRPGRVRNTWGLAESAALVGVLVVVARQGIPDWAVDAVICAGAAVSFLPLRGGKRRAVTGWRSPGRQRRSS